MRRWILAGLMAVGLLVWSAEAPAQVRVGARGPVVVGRPVGVSPQIWVSPRGRHVRRGPVVNPWWGGHTVGRPVFVAPAGPFGVPVVHRPVVIW